jgi:hypothetical protein
MKRREVALVSLASLLFGIVTLAASQAHAAPADTPICLDPNQYRAGDTGSSETGTGVSGDIITPSNGDIPDPGGLSSATDVFLRQTSSGSFVQVGWYTGTVAGMPVVNRPHLWVGENRPLGGERLRGSFGGVGYLLDWGAHYTFKISESPTGSGNYKFFLNGDFVTDAEYSHFSASGVPGFTGEIDCYNTTMEAIAVANAYPYNSLQSRGADGVTWRTFEDNRFHCDAGMLHCDHFESLKLLSASGTDEADGPF